MKKVIICLFAAFAAAKSFAGFAWYSTEINAILMSSGFPAEHRYLDNPIKLYGAREGAYWIPPYAVVNYVTGEVTTENESPTTISSFADLNNYGKYDPSVSVAHYQENCKQYVVDEFGQSYTFYDEGVAAFYSKYETLNVNAAVSAFDQLKTKFQIWISNLRSQTTGLSYDASELAEKVKQVDEALDKASSQLEETAKAVKERVEKFNQDVQAAQDHLANVANEKVQAANELINASVSDFSSFVALLEDALESGEGWKQGAETAYAKIKDTEQKILDAIEELTPYAEEEEVAQAINILNVQAGTIGGFRTSLRSAIDNDNHAAAEQVLNSARNSSLLDSRKAMQRIKNAEETYKSQAQMIRALAGVAIISVENIMNTKDEFDRIRDTLNEFMIATMDNFHEIGAFLCSTNSMGYLNWRMSHHSLGDMTEAQIAQWFNVSMQEPLFRDNDDKNNYETMSKLGKGTGSYNNIFRLIGSTYFVTYMDSEWMGRFINTYDSGSFNKDNIRGFYEEVVASGQTYTTNWYANKITAPKNWADGSTIVVTNGKFKVVESSRPWIYDGSTFINRYVQIGNIMRHATGNASGSGRYYLDVNLDTSDATLNKGESLPDNTLTHVYISLGRVSEEGVSYVPNVAPVIYTWMK